MATVVADMSMSLDGFIADRNDQVGPLFDWYQAGPVTTPSADEKWDFKTDEASAEQLRGALQTVGALICGRRLFDLTNAWGGASAVAQAKAIAGDKIVAIATPTITQQCLNLGLLDVVRVNLVPVLLGDGIRFFDHLRDTPIMLEDPEVTEGLRVTHLQYRVRKS
jgi:dihydrofolate reductase